MKQKPYIITKKRVTITTRKYNPKFGDNKVCGCGHPYYRHFDSYENMEACGCKYCRCRTWHEGTNADDIRREKDYADCEARWKAEEEKKNL